MVMRVIAKPKSISIVQVYAPTIHHEDTITDEFYDDVEECILKSLNKHFNTIQREWNSKIHTDAFQHRYGTAGKYL